MVAIEDFEMPTSCADCPFFSVFSQCSVTSYYEDEDYTNTERSEDCPLVEVEDGKID